MFFVRLILVGFALSMATACTTMQSAPPATQRATALDVQTVVGETINGLCVRDPVFGCKFCIGGTCTDARPMVERASFAQTRAVQRVVSYPAAPYSLPAAPPARAPTDPCAPLPMSYSMSDETISLGLVQAIAPAVESPAPSAERTAAGNLCPTCTTSADDPHAFMK